MDRVGRAVDHEFFGRVRVVTGQMLEAAVNAFDRSLHSPVTFLWRFRRVDRDNFSIDRTKQSTVGVVMLLHVAFGPDKFRARC